MNWNKILIFTFAYLCGNSITAQRYKTALEANEGNILISNYSYGGYSADGDFAKRYGSFYDVGVGVGFQTSKNWLLGIEGDYYFGQRVKEDVIAILRDEAGDIYGETFDVANIELRQRGWSTGAYVGKVFPILPSQPRSGIQCTVAGGYMRHFIRIQQDPTNTVFQTVGDFKKGYDRRAGGLYLRQGIGWRNLSNNRLINFYLGVETFQAFTTAERDFEFGVGPSDKSQKLDLGLGFRFSWTLPFYIGSNPDIIEY